MAIEPVIGTTDSAAAALAMSEMLADSPIGFAFLDTDFRYQALNQAIADFHGPELGNHIGVRMDEIIGAEAFASIQPLLQGALNGQQFEASVNSRMLAQHRVIRHAIVYGYPVHSPSGDVVGIGLLAVDSTNLKEAEERRERVDSQLQLALQAAGMGLWHWVHSEPPRVQWSRTAAALLGIDPSTDPSTEAAAEVLQGEQWRAVADAIYEAVETKTPFSYSFDVTWPDGSIHYLLAKGQVQYDLEPVELVGVLTDITAQRKAQQEEIRSAARQKRAGEQAIRMARVTAALSEAVTVSQVCEVLLGEGASAIEAPRRIIALLDESGSVIERMQYEGYGDNTPALARQNLSDEYPIPHTLRTGEMHLFANRQEIIEQFPDFESILRNSSSHACAVFPLVSHNQLLGAWSLVFPHDREFEEGELIILLTLAAQGAQAIERARMYERERTISDSLQRTLLPQGLPNVSGLTAATRYRPGTPGVKVGGDWYDVIRLASNRVALVIGDVGGHNIDSASIMGQLRNAVRSYSWENHPGARVMELANRLLCGTEPGKLATCCYIDLNLDDGIATVVTAGHPPPLIVDSERGSYFMQMPPGTPLGTTPDQEYKQTTLFLSPGSSIAMFTDGLVESRTLGVLQGMQGLSAAIEGHENANPEELADLLMRANAAELEADDVALLVTHFEPSNNQQTSTPDKRSIHRYLPSSASSAGVARRFAADVMEDWGADDLVDQVGLCVSELVTNALIHTAADVELVLRLSATSVRVEVIDHSDRMPVLRSSGDDDTSGRGLHIVDAIASDWGVEPAASGKSVWFQIQRIAAESSN